MIDRELVAGTRGSALARWQTAHVSKALTDKTGARVREKIIVTQGDVNLAERLAGTIEKGFFTAELEAELKGGTIDLAVHSLKDLPTRLTEGLDVAAVLPRHDAFDLLIVQPDAVEDHGPDRLPLKPGAKVGTSSLRRDALIQAFGPGANSQPLRGNVPTRIEKLRSRQYDAVCMAAAGVRRLGIDLTGLVVFELEPRRWPPAPGQGSVAVETRAGTDAVRSVVAHLDDAHSRAACERERAFLRVLEGGCTTPFGCYVNGERAWLGRAGLEDAPAPWRALSIALPPVDAPLTAELIGQALDALSRSTSFDPLSLSLEAAHVPLVRKV
jgi:hydroxymethylbilane synthase